MPNNQKQLKYLLLCVIFFFSKFSVAQNILDIFESLPDSVVLNLSIDERKKISSISKDNKNIDDAKANINKYKIAYAFENVDLKNAYIKLIGIIEGQLQICYWNLPDKYKLVGVYKETCGPVCITSQINFYLYNKIKGFDDRKLINVIPLKEIELQITNDLLNKCGEQANNILDNVLFQFPNNGKDIVLTYNNENTKYTNEICNKEIKITLSLLKENLKNTTYFGIKK